MLSTGGHSAEIRRDCLEKLTCFANDGQLVFFAAQRMHQNLLQFTDNNKFKFKSKLVVQMCSQIMHIFQCYFKI